jgi:hypothetical protein
MTKVISKKLLPIMGTLALVVALAVSFVPSPVYAQTASRDLPGAPVTVSTEFDVAITASGYGVFGQVRETLPAGFTYTDVTGLDDFQVGVVGQVVTFTLVGETAFTYSVMAPAAATTGTFAGILKDSDLVEYVVGGDTQVQVTIPTPPGPVELEFSGSVAKGERKTLLTPDIPGGVTELEITLHATADVDLELYDGTTFVIGWKAIIKSSGPTTGTYQGDTFAYSGWDGGDEYITADGPLSRAYTLKVYGFKAGNYDVTVSYMPGAPDITPPEISITAPDATVGVPTTIVVSATDLSGVAMVMFTVSSPSLEYPDIFETVMSFDDEATLTFTPGWAGTYTVEAMAMDNSPVHNMTPLATPETATFVVSE